MDDHAAPHILRVEPLAHARHEHDGELQPLALMNAHDPHCVGLFVRDIGLPVIHVVFLKLLDITHKVKQPLIAAPFKYGRLLHQHLHIRRPLFAPRHGGDIKAVSRLLQNLPEQLMDGRIGHQIPKTLQLCIKMFQPLLELTGADLPLSRFLLRPSCLYILLRRLIKRAFRISPADLRHLSCIQPCKGGCQHRGKGHVLPLVVQKPQIIQQHTDLICLKIAFPAARVGGNPFFHQNCRKDVRPAPDAPGQNHDVPVSCPPVLPGLFILHQPVSNQLLDSFRHHPGFHLPVGPFRTGPVLLVRCKLRSRRVQKQQLCLVNRTAVLSGKGFKIRPRIKRRLVVIHNPSQFPAHDPAEHVVHTVQHLRPAPEIFMKVDPLPVAVPGIVGGIFFHEQFRPRKAEPVDALLHIPHHKDVVPPPADRGYAGQNGFLDQVAVLIFVDHHLRELLLVFFRRRRGHQLPVLLCRQNLQGKLLHIAEINHIFALLEFSKFLSEPDHQLRKYLHGSEGGFHITQQFFRRFIKVSRGQILHQLFHLISERLDLLPFFRRDAFIFFRGQTLPRNRRDPPVQRRKIFCLENPFHHLQIRFQHVPIHIRPVRFLTDPDSLFKKLPDIRQVLLHLGRSLLEIYRLPYAAFCRI